MNRARSRLRVTGGLLLAGWAIALLAACSVGGEPDAVSLQPTVTILRATVLQPTAVATTRPAAITQAMFSQIAMTAAEVRSLYGTTPHTQQRTNLADVAVAYSSSPDLGQFLVGQNATTSYNSWAASGPCTVCAVQVPVMVFPSEAAATAAYDRIRQVTQTLYGNVQATAGFGAYWNASACQNGTFTSGGQTLNWTFCAARKGNAVITVAVGGFNFDATAANNGIRAYAGRVEAYLKTQLP